MRLRTIKKQTQTNPISNATTVFLLITQEIATALSRRKADSGTIFQFFFIAGKADLMYNTLAKHQ